MELVAGRPEFRPPSDESTHLISVNPGWRLVPLTRGPRQHFFGYFHLCPWNEGETRLALHRTSSPSAVPAEGEEVEICVMDVEDPTSLRPIGASTAWNWQQGSLLQWIGSNPDKLVFNVRAADLVSFRAKIVDTGTGVGEELERAVYTVAPDGRYAYTVDFVRLHFLRRGYGYTVHESVGRALDPAPGNDGLWRVDLATGRSELLVSLRRLLWNSPQPSMRGAIHWIDHVQPSRDGSRIGFLHRWSTADGMFFSRLLVTDDEGDNVVSLFAGGTASHYDWLDGRSLVGWFRPERPINILRMNNRLVRGLLQPAISLAHRWRRVLGGLTLAVNGDGFFRVDTKLASRTRVLCEAFVEDGHCAVAPDGARMIYDTYPDGQRRQHLGIYDFANGAWSEILSLESPEKYQGALRCDLHGRWSRRAPYRICFDGAGKAEGRQLFLVEGSR